MVRSFKGFSSTALAVAAIGLSDLMGGSSSSWSESGGGAGIGVGSCSSA